MLSKALRLVRNSTITRAVEDRISELALNQRIALRSRTAGGPHSWPNNRSTADQCKHQFHQKHTNADPYKYCFPPIPYDPFNQRKF